MIMGNKLM